jgi:hypothetical protein
MVGAAIPSSVANQHNRLQLGFCMRCVFARESHSQGLRPHPYVAHCVSSIVGFAMHNQHTHVQGVGGSNLSRLGCCMMWLGVWLGIDLQVHKVVMSSQYQLDCYLFTHKHLAHPLMSLVCDVVGAAIPSSVANQHNQLQLGFCMRCVFARESHYQGLRPHPYVAHCISSIVGFAMDNQHTCIRCWWVQPMSIGMLHDVARGQAGY